jgi:hypothetical protein
MQYQHQHQQRYKRKAYWNESFYDVKYKSINGNISTFIALIGENEDEAIKDALSRLTFGKTEEEKKEILEKTKIISVERTSYNNLPKEECYG